MKPWMILLGLAAALSLPGAGADDEKTVTWTGWFSDAQCAAATTAGGKFGPTNPDCAKSCIEKGVPPVFISEQAKAIFTVEDYPSVIDDLGYHVEVHATLDDAAKTIRIREVKRLEYQGPACARRKK